MGLAQQAGTTTITTEDVQVDVGETTNVTITASAFPNGFSGADFVASLENPDVATITNVAFSDQLGLTSGEINANGSNASLRVADVNRNVEPGVTNVTIATLTIEGTAEGETGIAIGDTNFDAEEGDPIDVAVNTGTITVGEGGEPQQPDEPANFEVSNLDAPSTVTQGETVSVSANVTNTGGSEATQTVEFRIDTDGDGTLETIGVNQSLTLAPNVSETVTFEVSTDSLDAGTYTHGVFTANDSATAQLTVEAEQPEPEPEPEEPANFSVSNLSAPSTVTQGETATVTANVTNVGESEGTQTVEFRIDTDGDGTLETIGINESLTLAPNVSETVSFEVSTDSLDAGTYTHGVFTANDSATAQLTVEAEQPEPEPEPPETVYYQVDFVAGEPLEHLGGDYPLYAEQDRLLRFAHGNTDEGITQLGNAWASEDIREAVDYGHISKNNDTASVTFTVADGESVTLSLAAYEKPGPGFDPAETQTLINASTETFGPGEHTITVHLPDENGSDDGNATADLDAGAAPAALAA